MYHKQALPNCDNFTIITILCKNFNDVLWHEITKITINIKQTVLRERVKYFCSRSVYHPRLINIPSTVYGCANCTNLEIEAKYLTKSEVQLK